jgi:hypothetical protein
MTALLTPSTAYGCLDLLKSISQQTINITQAATLNFGAIPTSRVLEYAVSLKCVVEQPGGGLEITDRGKTCLELEQTVSQLRYLLSHYFVERRDPWLQLARRGRFHVLLQAPPEITQLLHEAELAEGDEEEIVLFWDRLAERVRGEKDRRNLEIGRIGERLTIQFETERTGRKPDWMALESDHFGYDVLSSLSADDRRFLKIETKCSFDSIAKARFHVTRHEWRTAEASEEYQFHIWNLEGKSKQLAVLNTTSVAPHIPINQSSGSWEVVEIPQSAFQDHFRHCGL